MTLTPRQIEILKRLRWVPYLHMHQLWFGSAEGVKFLRDRDLVWLDTCERYPAIGITPAGIEALKEIDNDHG